MAKQPRQGGRLIERRNGQEGFAWEGIATKVDPAGAPPNRPRDLVNVRMQGGIIISRPGFQGEGGFIPLIPLHDLDTVDGAERPQFEVAVVNRVVPHWLADHATAAGTRLWLTAEVGLGFSTASVGFVDTDADSPFQTVATLTQLTSGFPVPIEKFNNEFYVGDFGGLKKMYLVPSREGAIAPPLDSGRLADEVIVQYPMFRSLALQEHEGKLFVVISDSTAPAGEILTWDGLTVNSELVLAPASDITGAIAAVYKDTLVVAVRDYTALGQGALLIRDAAGVWTTVTLVGFNPTRLPNGIAEYGDLLYIADGVDSIFTWDGTTLALAFTLPAGAGALNCFARLAGRLYFCYEDGNSGLEEVGFVDQDNDVLFRYTAPGTRAGVMPLDVPATAMGAYRGRLWLGYTTLGGQVIAWHSQQFVPYDGWQTTQDAISFSVNIPPFSGITNMRTL